MFHRTHLKERSFCSMLVPRMFWVFANQIFIKVQGSHKSDIHEKPEIVGVGVVNLECLKLAIPTNQQNWRFLGHFMTSVLFIYVILIWWWEMIHSTSDAIYFLPGFLIYHVFLSWLLFNSAYLPVAKFISPDGLQFCFRYLQVQVHESDLFFTFSSVKYCKIYTSKPKFLQ